MVGGFLRGYKDSAYIPPHLSVPDQVITALVFAEGGGRRLRWLKHGKWTHFPVAFQFRLIYSHM